MLQQHGQNHVRNVHQQKVQHHLRDGHVQVQGCHQHRARHLYFLLYFLLYSSFSFHFHFHFSLHGLKPVAPRGVDGAAVERPRPLLFRGGAEVDGDPGPQRAGGAEDFLCVARVAVRLEKDLVATDRPRLPPGGAQDEAEQGQGGVAGALVRAREPHHKVLHLKHGRRRAEDVTVKVHFRSKPQRLCFVLARIVGLVALYINRAGFARAVLLPQRVVGDVLQQRHQLRLARHRPRRQRIAVHHTAAAAPAAAACRRVALLLLLAFESHSSCTAAAFPLRLGCVRLCCQCFRFRLSLLPGPPQHRHGSAREVVFHQRRRVRHELRRRLRPVVFLLRQGSNGVFAATLQPFPVVRRRFNRFLSRGSRTSFEVSSQLLCLACHGVVAATAAAFAAAGGAGGGGALKQGVGSLHDRFSVRRRFHGAPPSALGLRLSPEPFDHDLHEHGCAAVFRAALHW
mmetsp:Transcript_46732/g.92472  ORF Transcript_46732/g.92472 Transcript_46732/m.92472 type:complete len:455 (+) Transcript_46732:1235-2599(+)